MSKRPVPGSERAPLPPGVHRVGNADARDRLDEQLRSNSLRILVVCALCAVIAATIVGTSSAGDTAHPPGFRAMMAHLSGALRVVARRSDLRPEDRLILEQSLQDAAFLSAQWRPGSHVSKRYTEMLAFDILVVQNSNEFASGYRTSALAFVHEDLRAKRHNCAANLASGVRGLGDDVKVYVNVVDRQGKPANGYWVFASYAWLFESRKKIAPVRFDSDTSPAKATLPPGNYVLWAATDYHNPPTTPDTQSFYILESSQTIDLRVPK
jgi:hypothetical protein